VAVAVVVVVTVLLSAERCLAVSQWE